MIVKLLSRTHHFQYPKADEISDTLLVETIPYTLHLINITKSKHLIFLSGKKCFERLLNLSKMSENIQFKYKIVCGNIYVGVLNGKLCIGIPHPAYKTNEELNLVASVIPYLISSDNYEHIDIALIQKECAKQIKEYEERIHNKKRQIKISDVRILVEKLYQNAILRPMKKRTIGIS